MFDDWNLIQDLLDHNLNHILTTIMLHLDPASLKCAESVCRSLRDFIQENIWGRKQIKKYLQENHLEKWKQVKFKERTFRVFSFPENILAHSLSCDEYLMVVGLNNGIAKVFHINTCAIQIRLDCRREMGVVEHSYVSSDISDQVIATVTSLGQVSIWKRQFFLELYKNNHHGCTVSHNIKISGSLIILAARECVEVLSLEGSMVHMVYKLMEFGDGAVTSVDCDGRWILAGTSRYIKLWNLESCQCSVSIPSGFVNCALLHYPFCFTVGSGSGGGVWDLVTGQLVKTFGESNYSQLRSNERFLVASQTNLHLRKYKDDPSRCPPLNVTLFDIRDLTSLEGLEDIFASNIDPDVVWNKKFGLVDTQSCSSTINMTVLLALQDNVVYIWDFWNKK